MYYLNPLIKKDGFAYSRYLIHRAFNLAHIYGDADYIGIHIIESTTVSGHPDLSDVFVDRLNEFCYGGVVCDIETFFTYYTRFIYRKSCEVPTSSYMLFEHLYEIACDRGSYHDAMRDSHRNAIHQIADLHRQVKTLKSIIQSSHNI